MASVSFNLDSINPNSGNNIGDNIEPVRFVDKLNDLIKTVIEQCQETLDENIYEAESITNELNETIKRTLFDSREDAESLNKETIQFFMELSKTNQQSIACIELNRSKMKTLLHSHLIRLQDIYEDANEKRKKIRNELENYVEAIQDSIEHIEKIIKRIPLNNVKLIESYECFEKRKQNFDIRIKKILVRSKEALNTAEQKASEIENEFNKNMRKAVLKYNKSSASIRNTVERCIKSAKK